MKLVGFSLRKLTDVTVIERIALAFILSGGEVWSSNGRVILSDEDILPPPLKAYAMVDYLLDHRNNGITYTVYPGLNYSDINRNSTKKFAVTISPTDDLSVMKSEVNRVDIPATGIMLAINAAQLYMSAMV